jgi:hypothetical protein
MVESNVRDRQTCERNLEETERNLKRIEGSFEKSHNFNKVSCKEVVKTLEDVNFKHVYQSFFLPIKHVFFVVKL